MRADGDAPVTVRRLSPPADFGAELAEDVRLGFTGDAKSLSSKYFYDTRGSELFEDITRLPEYYLTRAETEILEAHADDIVAAVRPSEIVELGSGYSVKTKLLIDAMRRADTGARYVPMDISEGALREAAMALCNYYPWLAVDGLVGDYFTDLDKVPRHGRRIVTFLGSTIGNYLDSERNRFFRSVRAVLEPGDALLLGVDLVKDVAALVAAYDDSAGVTAEFNKNMLHVLNRELDADFPIDEFAYVASWNPDLECIEMGLRATRATEVKIKLMDLVVSFAEGELLHNEVSCKFRRETIASELQTADLEIIGWYTDPANRFAMALASPFV